MKIEIRSNCYPFYEEKEMSLRDFHKLRNETHRAISEWFKWDDYPAEYRHLVISAEIISHGEVRHINLYKQGYLMTDAELDNIAKRQWIDIGLVHAIHKKDIPPCEIHGFEF